MFQATMKWCASIVHFFATNGCQWRYMPPYSALTDVGNGSSNPIARNFATEKVS